MKWILIPFSNENPYLRYSSIKYWIKRKFSNNSANITVRFSYTHWTFFSYKIWKRKAIAYQFFLAKKRTLTLHTTSIPLQSVQVPQTKFPFRAEKLFRHFCVTIRLIKWTPEQPPGWELYSEREFCSEHLDWLLCLIWMHINDTWLFLWNIKNIMQYTINTQTHVWCPFVLWFFSFFFSSFFFCSKEKKWQCQVEKERNLILCHKVPSITSSRSKRIEKKGRWKNL